jgi:hypothetical protein
MSEMQLDSERYEFWEMQNPSKELIAEALTEGYHQFSRRTIVAPEGTLGPDGSIPKPIDIYVFRKELMRG